MLSPPGAGKGTHSAHLAQASGAGHISSGELLRAEIARGSELGARIGEYTTRGDLVPDDLIFDVLVPVVRHAVEQSGGYILDGFPRTLAQARRAAELGGSLRLSADAAVYLTAPRHVLVSRLRARAERERRADDTPSVIERRLVVFAAQTRPLVEYYRDRGILLEVDADRPEIEVQDELRRRLEAEAR